MRPPIGFDLELNDAWLETHSRLPGVVWQAVVPVERPILGGAVRVYDGETGVCLRIEYHNPAIEQHQEIAHFFAEIRRRAPSEG